MNTFTRSLFYAALCIAPAFATAQPNGQLLYEIPGKESAYPRLSQDGSKILYQSNKDGAWQLYSFDTTTQVHTRITRDTFNNNLPDWSPDNSMIAFVSDRDGNEEIYLMNSDGTDMRRLTNNPARDIHPYFSPDGKYLLFNSDRGNGSFDIYRITLDGKNLMRITDTPENETCARYSPDMTHILYLKNSETFDDLFTLDLATGLSDNISKTPMTTDGWPMYSADGQWIYFSSMETGIYSIYRIRTSGGEKEQLTFPSPGEEDARVCVSRKNDFFIYNKKVGTTISIFKATLG